MQDSSSPRPKLEGLYASIGSDVTAVSRLDERVDEAGFMASGHATYGSGWGNTSAPINALSFPVPTLPYSPVSDTVSFTLSKCLKKSSSKRKAE